MPYPFRSPRVVVRAGLPLVIAAAVIGGIGLSTMRAQDTPRPDDVAVFMRAKLDHAQHVFAGLALADFDRIARGANELALASQASSWQVLQTPEYARHSAEFRRSCESLRSAARAENLDGAALAWMEVTMKCIQCHRYVRDEREPESN
jgi:hypothetical protein